jgi:serine/threonine protein kinase
MLMDRYAVERELGRGGMGQVYLARDQVLERLVAVKLIRPRDPHLRERTMGEQNLRQAFVREAVIGANLNHPAIATVFDFGFHENEPLIVFEYVDGETLRETLARRGRLPLDDVRLILAPLAQALQFAHSRHIVHRDLKPANIRSTIHGQYKILDMGLATEFRQTADWRFAGTPRYASPEQAAGLACDGRTDQYALALIAFEMLTGRPVFEAKGVREMLRLHREQLPPALRLFLPNAPEGVEQALARALAKDPARRFTSCEEFAAALGCQFLTPAETPAELLRLAKVSKMKGLWSSKRRSFQLRLPSPIYLALAGNSFWVSFRGELRRWPLSQVELGEPRYSWLVLYLDGKYQAFRFHGARECKDWYAQIRQLLESLPEGDQEAGPKSTRPVARVEPVLLLPRRPSIRYQTLGTADCTADDRGLAEMGLKVRAALMGAEAVIDVQEERFAELDRTRWRQSGTAIRAVDSNGRLDLLTRWFGSQCRTIANRLLLFLALVLILRLFAGSLFTLLRAGSGRVEMGELRVELLMFFLLAAWPVAALIWLRATLIPQLLRPASLTLLVYMLMPTVVVVGDFLVSRSGEQDWLSRHSRVTHLLYLFDPINVGVIVLAVYFCQRSGNSYRQYKTALQQMRPTRSAPRRFVARTAWTATAVFAVAVIGWAFAPGVFSLAEENRLGNRLAVSPYEEIYYRNVSKEDARKLGVLLQRIHVFDGFGHRTVLVAREADVVKLTFVVAEGFWNDPAAVRDFEEVGQMVRREVFGNAPMEVHLADSQLNVKKTLAIR